MRTLAGHFQVVLSVAYSARVYAVAFSRDGKWIVTGSGDKLVKIWETATGAEVRSFVGARFGWRGGGIIVRRFAHIVLGVV